MKYRYTLPANWVERAARFGEFRMGAMQVTIRTHDGAIYERVLLSNCTHPIAMRGHSDLPFGMEDIADIYQTEDDLCPQEQSNWEFWDDWSAHKRQLAGKHRG